MMYRQCTDKIIQIIICTLIHSSFFVLNLMLPACGPNFAKVVHT